jgi:nitroreductase
VLMEVGALFQTVYLVAQSLGLGACALGGIAGEAELSRLAGFDPREEPLLGMLALGPSLENGR